MSMRAGQRSDGDGSSGGEVTNRMRRGLSPSIRLYIAINDFSAGFHYHWALALYNETTGQWDTYEVIRTHENGPFAPHHFPVDPRSSASCHDPLIYVATCPSTSLHQIHRTIQGVAIQSYPDWNCQNYVIEIFDALIRANLITQTEYVEAWDRVVPFFGKMEREFGTQEPAAAGNGYYQMKDTDSEINNNKEGTY